MFSFSAPNTPSRVRLQEVPPNSLTVSWETLVPKQSSLHFDVQVTNVTSGENIFYKNLVSTSKLKYYHFVFKVVHLSSEVLALQLVYRGANTFVLECTL